MSPSRQTQPESAEPHARIASIDSAIIELLHQRRSAASELAALRRAGRAPRVQLALENEVVRRYSEELGNSGTRLALLLLRDPA
ncbi:chorismate mutase [Streptomyces sp. NPDC091385]|uniref:chorismate mutase n=1 Tax=Streptomyces sp. NPDC091385 TaxID=3365997 RepID=UPI0038056080